MPPVSIIVVTFDSLPDVDACLGSLAAAPPRAPCEIVVVDNASADGTPDRVRQRWPHVRLIDAGANLGFARACNIGIRSASGEAVLLLNPDTSVPAGALDRLVDALDRRADVAVVGPRIVDAAGRPELSFGAMASPWSELRQKVLVRGHDRGVAPVSWLVERMTRRSRLVDWVSGACLLARRADLEAAGLLDERYFLYFEDVDLCASIRGRGRNILFLAEVEVVHRRGASAARAPRAARAAYRESHLAFYRKHHPGWASLLEAYLRLRGA
jgi:hypothetical protein